MKKGAYKQDERIGSVQSPINTFFHLECKRGLCNTLIG